MNLHLINPEEWHNLHSIYKREWQKILNLNSEAFSVRLFTDMASAVYEITHSCAQFYAHKKSVLIQQGGSPYLSHLVKQFMREGYLVETLNKKILEQDAQWNIWEAELKKDLIFAVFQVDHPVTGEKYDWSQAIEKLENKKIFNFTIHHELHEVPKLTPYSVHLVQGKNFCIALCSERFKAPSLFTEMKKWEKDSNVIQTEVDYLNYRLSLEKDEEFKKTILENESFFSIEKAVNPSQQKNRFFDRSVLSLSHLNSDIASQRIAKQFPQYSRQIHNINLCTESMTIDQLKWWELPFETSKIPSLLILERAPSMDRAFIEWLVRQDSSESSMEFEIKI